MSSLTQTKEERRVYLVGALSYFLTHAKKYQHVRVEVSRRLRQNVDLSFVPKGLRAIVSQRGKALPGPGLAEGAGVKLEAMGFSGGGRKGCYRRFGLPTDAIVLAQMIDEIMIIAFNLKDSYSVTVRFDIDIN